MPQPTRAERAEARKRDLKAQETRNAKSFSENKYAEHDATAIKEAKAARQKAQAEVKARLDAPKRRAGSSRTVPPSSQKKS